MEILKKYLKRYKVLIGGVLILTFLNAMAELYLPNLMSQIVDVGIIEKNISYVIETGIRMLIVALFATIGMIISSYMSSMVAMSISRDMRKDVFSHIESFSLGEFGKIGTSSLITRTINDINQMQQFVLMSLRILLSAPFMLIGGLIMALSKNKVLSLILLGAMPALLIVILVIGRKAHPLFMEVQKKIDSLNLVLREKLTGVRIVRAFDRVEYEEERFDEANKILAEKTLNVGRLMSSMQPFMIIILNMTIVAVIWFGAKEVDLGNMQVGDLMAFIQYIGLVMFSIIMVSVMFIVLPRASASAERINEVLDMKPSIVDKEETKRLDEVEVLEFDDVSFRYPGAENRTLCNISFKVKKGETLSIIGGTGSGKSSLINLIPRFFDVSDGSIKINGIDIRDLKQKDLRDKIGYVPQDVVLFRGTVEENIRYGKEDATDEEVKHAAEIAQASDFIESMEDGYKSYVAQGGTNYSGGQKQRLSIARAVVRRPDIFIFDDSFSALDYKTDSKLREALKEITEESIVIIIAQRVSSVKGTQNIIVLDEGVIDGIGNHEELMKTSKVYEEIVNSQLSEEEI